jgi:PhnB protein
MVKAKANPIPPGFRTVTPYLAVNGGVNAIEFYTRAFGAKEIPRTRQQTPDGKIIHARLKIGDSLVMLSDHFGSDDGTASEGTSPVMLHIYSKDVDKLWKAATSAGAKVIMPLDNQFWGERYGQLVDPFGHRWSVSMRVKMSKKEMEDKQKQAMTMFAQNEHPGKEK